MLRVAALSLLALILLAPPIPAQEPTPLAKARALKDEGEYEKARTVLVDAIDGDPKNVPLLLEMGKVLHLRARELLAENASLGRLALYDAKTWYGKALALSPESIPALQLIGQVAVELGDWKAGAEAWKRAAALNPEDGESRYQLGYCLALSNRFEAAVAAFREAARILGPDPRLLLNQGISHSSLGQTSDARRCFEALVRGEIEAGRRGGRHMSRGVLWLWKIHSASEDWAGAEVVFARLAKEHPDISAAHWYLGHARLKQGNAVGAAASFGEVTTIVPTWPDGWRQLGTALVRAKEHGAAEEALVALVKLDPDGQKTQELLFEIVDALSAEGRLGDAIEAMGRLLPSFPGDSLVLEARGDLFFRAGEMEKALADYEKVIETYAFAGEAVVKAGKAGIALLRAGRAKAGSGPIPTGGEAVAPREGAPILDFERPSIFVRVTPGVSGRREGGRFVAERTGTADLFANVNITFIPTLSTKPYASLRFDVKGPEGSTLLIRAKDGYDEFGNRLDLYRVLHRTPVVLAGEWQTVTLPLSGFATASERRPIDFEPARLRALAFQLGEPGGAAKNLAGEIRLDNVALVPEEGEPFLVASFDRTPEETLFITDGAGAAFARTLFSREQIATFVPDANTFVTREIFRDRFDEGMVHSGRGAFRLTAAKEGAASGVLSFNPDRSFDKATAIVFWARGAKGAEMLRVTMEDAIDSDLRNAAPASAPRLMNDGRLLDGWFSLSPEWRRYRIPRAEFPDVDFGSLLRIRFHYGTPEGNAVGAVIYLDDIAWE